MASIFDNLKRAGDNAITWLRQNAAKLNNVSPTQLMRDADNKTNYMQMGKMYMFFYDPKHKATLPYYDRFPLVIPIERYPDGFLGLNMHYLAPKLRLSLLEGLMKIRNNQSMNDSTRMMVTYDLLSSTKRHRYFKPTLKRYLHTHVQSQFLNIKPNEWETAIFLPVERFVKKNKKAVWQLSKELLS
tara:strand:+ start:728 stop:1285 length:558 start_codon:yes stop_codon:yes gene_type:complete